MTITVAILLGGQSVRMGEPKHMLQVCGEQTLMDVMIDIALSISTSIVTVGGKYGNLPYVLDMRHETGPLAGIEALLHSTVSQKYLVLGCDMPYVNKQVLEPLMQSLHPAAYIHDDRILGLPFTIESSFAKQCTESLDGGTRSLKAFLSQINCQTLPINHDELTYFSSLNTPADVDNFTLKHRCS